MTFGGYVTTFSDVYIQWIAAHEFLKLSTDTHGLSDTVFDLLGWLQNVSATHLHARQRYEYNYLSRSLSLVEQQTMSSLLSPVTVKNICSLTLSCD